MPVGHSPPKPSGGMQKKPRLTKPNERNLLQLSDIDNLSSVEGSVSSLSDAGNLDKTVIEITQVGTGEGREIQKIIREIRKYVVKSMRGVDEIRLYCEQSKTVRFQIKEEVKMVSVDIKNAKLLLDNLEGTIKKQEIERIEKAEKLSQVTQSPKEVNKVVSYEEARKRGDLAEKHTQTLPPPSINEKHEISKAQEDSAGKVGGNSTAGTSRGQARGLDNDKNSRNEPGKEKIRNEKEVEEEEAARRREKESREKRSRFPRAHKAEAILVKVTEGRTYADLFKEIKTKTNRKIDGIETIRKSRGGDLVIELGKETNSKEFEKVVQNALGKSSSVRRLSPKINFEIKDIDPTIEKDELINELAERTETDLRQIEIKNIRFAHGGTRTAIVSLPAESAIKLDAESRIRIGCTYCKIKRALNLIRCFRCHDFGHMSYTCTAKMKERELCRRCGCEGHQINDCKSKRCCILCIRKGIPDERAEHVAGAANCPEYKKYIQELEGRRN